MKLTAFYLPLLLVGAFAPSAAHCEWASATGAPPSATSSSLGVGAVSYFGTVQSEHDSVFSSLHGRWRGNEKGKLLEAAAQAELMLSMNRASYHFIEVPEAYLATSSDLSFVQLAVGRRQTDWSQLDRNWELGVFEPRFRWDYLHPERVGLLGGFINVDQSIFKLTAFATPVFIPERGAPLAVQGGTFNTFSPWFLAPPSRMVLFERETEVRYRLQMPELSDVIFNPGGALRARLGAENGPWASAAYAYKPVNQLLLGYSDYLDLTNLQGQVVLHPRVLYHHVASVEAGFDSELFGASVSMLSDRPMRDKTDPTWTTQELAPSLAFSTSIDLDLAETQLALSWLRHWGKTAADRGPSASGKSTAESRFPFGNALSFNINSPLVSTFSFSSRVVYDLEHEGTMLSGEVRFEPRRHWLIGLGADVLGSTAGNTENPDFITRYRANDRVHGGVSYVF